MRHPGSILLLFLIVLPAFFGGTLAEAAPLPARPSPGVFFIEDRDMLSLEYPWAAGSVARFGWAEVEPLQGIYDFSAIDAWLEGLDAGGKAGVMGIWLRCGDRGDGTDRCAPSWALGWDPVIAAGRPRLNYLDRYVSASITALADALAARYAQDVRLSHVEINFGYEGEASPCPTSDDRQGQCQAYRARYGDDDQIWTGYVGKVIEAYVRAFRGAGGHNHVPLMATISGSFGNGSERASIISAAQREGVGIHLSGLSASFLAGEHREGLCGDKWTSDIPGYREEYAYATDWVAAHRMSSLLPLSVELSPPANRSEAGISDEEHAWWSVLNALDKGAQVLYVDVALAAYADAWSYFMRYAGADERSSPDAWVALRGGSDAWCGDASDYEWLLYHRREAAGGGGRYHLPTDAGGRLGTTWQGAYSRSTHGEGGRASLYFDVDDRFMHGGEQVVLVEVTYWDGRREDAGITWALAYDSVASPNQEAGRVTLGGTGRWVTQPFILIDAAMQNRLPDAAGQRGNDLRLYSMGGDVAFHRVRLERLAEIARGSPHAGSGSGGMATSPTPTPTSTPLPLLLAQKTPTATATAFPTVEATQRTASTPVRTNMPDHGTESVSPSPEATPTVAGSDTLIYQARGGAAVVSDTFISIETPEENYRSANTLVVSDDGGKVALLSFDLSMLSPDAEINAAWLEMTVVGRNQPQELAGVLDLMTIDWRDETITWENASRDKLRERSQEVVTFAFPAEGSLQVRVDEVVRAWVRDPSSNQGLLVRGEGAGGTEYYLASSEWRVGSARPRLRVRLGEGGVPLPTATPTPIVFVEDSLSYHEWEEATQDDRINAAVADVAPAGDGEQQLFDIIAYLSLPDGSIPPCDWMPTVRLWAAAGQFAARPLGIGRRDMVSGEAGAFPVWRFDGIDLDSVRGEESIVHLFVTVDGEDIRHNIYTLGEDLGTIYPRPMAPQQWHEEWPALVDASIEILWPHGGVEAPAATRANIGVALFVDGTREVLPAALGKDVEMTLHWAYGRGPDQAGREPPRATPRLIQVPWQTYYLWEFHDIDVAVAQQEGNYINFWVEVVGPSGVEFRSNIWSHGFGPRSLETVVTPAGSCQPAPGDMPERDGQLLR